MSHAVTLSDLLNQPKVETLPTMRYVDTPITTAKNVRQDIANAEAVLAVGDKLYGASFIKGFDWYYKQKLQNSGLYRALNIATGHSRQTEPVAYKDEILAVDAATKGAGTLALNFSYDVACSTGIFINEQGQPELIRMLDWALKMAPMTTVITRQGNHGNWIDITYPGLAGSLTSQGENFAAAINRAPVPYVSSPILDHTAPGYLPPFGDNIRSRIYAALSNDISPIHLMRQAFEECSTFDQAIEKISTTKTNCPVIIPIIGKTADEAAIIYKERDRAAIATLSGEFDRLTELFAQHANVEVFEEQHLAAANHWPEGYRLRPAHPRRDNSTERSACLAKILAAASEKDIFDLLQVAGNDTTGQHIVSNTALIARMCVAKKQGVAIAMEDQKPALKPLSFGLAA